jgi:hypothetical protein
MKLPDQICNAMSRVIVTPWQPRLMFYALAWIWAADIVFHRFGFATLPFLLTVLLPTIVASLIELVIWGFSLFVVLVILPDFIRIENEDSW